MEYDIVPKGIPVGTGGSKHIFKDGLSSAGISLGGVKRVYRLFSELYLVTQNKNKKGKPITNDAPRHVRGAVFALGSEGLNDEWKEHTASSLREMLHPWKDLRVVATYAKQLCDESQLSSKEKTELERICNRLYTYYEYFSCIVHHEPAGICFKYRELTNETLGSYEECITSEKFKLVVATYFNEVNVKGNPWHLYSCTCSHSAYSI